MESFLHLLSSLNRGEQPSSTPQGEGLEFELFKAAVSGDLELFKGLLRYLEVKDGLAETIACVKEEEDGGSFLHAAASGGANNVCKYLVEEVKLDVNMESTGSGETPLHYAIQSRHYHTAVYLLENGANPNATSKDGTTPLHSAASTLRDSKITKLLLSKGADPNKVASRGTPLLIAASFGNKDCVEALLNSYANPNVIPCDIISPLIASIEAESIECVELLLKAGADPNLDDPMGSSPLSYAAVKGSIKMIKCLLKAKADPNAIDNLTGAKPIEGAALNFDLEALRILLPVTTPFPTISDWSIDGIMKHVHSAKGREERKSRLKVDASLLKSEGEDSLKAKNYLRGISVYSKVIAAYPNDVESLFNRSICYAQIEEGEGALQDALRCISLRPDWPMAYHRLGAVFMLLKKFEDAADAFYHGLKLDAKDKEIEHSFWDAMKALSDASS